MFINFILFEFNRMMWRERSLSMPSTEITETNANSSGSSINLSVSVFLTTCEDSNTDAHDTFEFALETSIMPSTPTKTYNTISAMCAFRNIPCIVMHIRIEPTTICPVCTARPMTEFTFSVRTSSHVTNGLFRLLQWRVQCFFSCVNTLLHILLGICSFPQTLINIPGENTHCLSSIGQHSKNIASIINITERPNRRICRNDGHWSYSVPPRQCVLTRGVMMAMNIECHRIDMTSCCVFIDSSSFINRNIGSTGDSVANRWISCTTVAKYAVNSPCCVCTMSPRMPIRTSIQRAPSHNCSYTGMVCVWTSASAAVSNINGNMRRIVLNSVLSIFISVSYADASWLPGNIKWVNGMHSSSGWCFIKSSNHACMRSVVSMKKWTTSELGPIALQLYIFSL